MNWVELIHKLPENCEEEIWKKYIKSVIIPDVQQKYKKKIIMSQIKERSKQILSSMFINNALKVMRREINEETLDLVYEMLLSRPELLLSEKYYKDFIEYALLTNFSRMEP